MTSLLDAVAHPLWIRDGEDALVWANQAYLQAVEAADIADATARSVELLDRPTRDEANRQRRSGSTFAARVPAVVAGQRSVLDVVERPTGNGSAGIAVDVSELEAVRIDLQRQMDAQLRTLDQLPTAVAIFDGEPEPDFQQRGLSATVESRHGVPRLASDRQRSARPPSRRPQAPRAGRFPRLEGGHPRGLSLGRTPTRPGGTFPIGAPCASSSTPTLAAASLICSTM